MSKIEWTEKTWNPIRGCSRISRGCEHCYAERMAARFSGMCGDPSKPRDTTAPFFTFIDDRGRWTGRVELIESKLEEPLHWRKPSMVFVNSMSDLLHENLPDTDIFKVLDVIAGCRRHTFQVLTKRASRLPEVMDRYYAKLQQETQAAIDQASWEGREQPWEPSVPLENLWLGVSCENQKTADERIPLLLQTPAAVRFVSLEPLLGPVDLNKYLDGHEEHGIDLSRPVGSRVGCCIGWTPPLDWVIVGGESGPGARPMNLLWARSIVAQCKAAGTPVFVKQLGSFWARKENRNPEQWEQINGKGGDPSDWPEDLRVREMPGGKP